MAIARVVFLGFAIGLTFGIFTTYVTLDYHRNGGSLNRYLRYGKFSPTGANYVEFDDDDEVHGAHSNGTKRVRLLPSMNFDKDMNDKHHRLSRNSSDRLKKVRVLCWVMTSPKTLYAKGRPVKETWGKRCDKLLFMSSKEDKSFPAVGLDVPEGHEKLWYKTRAAWQYVFDHHMNDAEWFLKADDDTYVIVENLKLLCSKYNPEKPYFFGRHFKTFGGYNSGGAGYVFSKETLRRFGKLLKNPRLCSLESFAEDVEVGKCLANVGVHPGDSRDSRHRETFHPFPPEHHLIQGYVPKDSWLYQYNNHPVIDGPDCCADHSIAFHYISPNMMYQLEYFVYHLRPYGMEHHDE